MNLKLFESMTVGYAYDFGVSALNVAGRNSHEIVISLTACDKDDPFFSKEAVAQHTTDMYDTLSKRLLFRRRRHCGGDA